MTLLEFCKLRDEKGGTHAMGQLQHALMKENALKIACMEVGIPLENIRKEKVDKYNKAIFAYIHYREKKNGDET